MTTLFRLIIQFALETDTASRSTIFDIINNRYIFRFSINVGRIRGLNNCTPLDCLGLNMPLLRHCDSNTFFLNYTLVSLSLNVLS